VPFAGRWWQDNGPLGADDVADLEGIAGHSSGEAII
jgi:hypothetical protein